MDVRIINREGNMYAVGNRTLRTNGKVLALLNEEGHLEAIAGYEAEEIAENVKREIIKKIERRVKDGERDIIIEM